MLNSALEKDLKFTYSIQNKMHSWYKGDSGRIRQILTNLLHNAIKFTQQGNILLTCEVLNESKQHATLQFSVDDTGIGLTQEQQANLFQPFSQGDNSTTRKYGGTGLGLSICQQLSQLMNGSLTVKSQINKGTQFIFTITLDKSIQAENQVRKLQVINKNRKSFDAKILVVDDMRVNLEVTRGMLEIFGITVAIAENGQQAIDYIEKEHYDLILMDCQMPIMDGYQATKAIRSGNLNIINSQVPIIAMTANAMQGDKEICLNAGMDDYLSKPLDLDELSDMLVKWLPSKLHYVKH